ncbi:hypothetical protein LCGC14_1418940 [marine sediment metagenome]|uniref:Uncharacterized protein n=1 Tax=marine sediment metagenome TaxID=412755 RepID=A0A0F9MTN1_9ZZZZ
MPDWNLKEYASLFKFGIHILVRLPVWIILILYSVIRREDFAGKRGKDKWQR